MFVEIGSSLSLRILVRVFTNILQVVLIVSDYFHASRSKAIRAGPVRPIAKSLVAYTEMMECASFQYNGMRLTFIFFRTIQTMISVLNTLTVKSAKTLSIWTVSF
jgi:hypothetical protein